MYMYVSFRESTCDYMYHSKKVHVITPEAATVSQTEKWQTTDPSFLLDLPSREEGSWMNET